MIAALFRRLRTDARGVTVIEFALVTPVLAVLMLGMFDLMYQRYIQSVLDGALIKAGRDSAIESNASEKAGDAMDATVQRLVRTVAVNAKFQSQRLSYASFGLVKPEPFTDRDGDGVRDPKECFDDINGNGVWDADPGVKSQGGANDVTKYTMWVTYPRLFAASAFFGSATKTISSTTILKNQPYRVQQKTEVKSVCT